MEPKLEFLSYSPPMGPKFQFPENSFPTTFVTRETCFTTPHMD